MAGHSKHSVVGITEGEAMIWRLGIISGEREELGRRQKLETADCVKEQSKGTWILLISLNEEVTVSSSPFTANLLVAGTKYRKETAQGGEFHFGSWLQRDFNSS